MPRFSSAAISAMSTDREITTYCLATTRNLKSLIKPQSNHSLMIRKSGHFGEVSFQTLLRSLSTLDVIRIDVNRHEPHTVSLIFTAAKLLHQVM